MEGKKLEQKWIENPQGVQFQFEFTVHKDPKSEPAWVENTHFCLLPIYDYYCYYYYVCLHPGIAY